VAETSWDIAVQMSGRVFLVGGAAGSKALGAGAEQGSGESQSYWEEQRREAKRCGSGKGSTFRRDGSPVVK
jgi:hypothetical protein